MHALITGGAGFIGSHLSEYLIRRGHRVSVLDDLSTGRLSNLDSVIDDDAFSMRIGSILDETLVDEMVAGCDHVFHLAAAVGVHLIVDHPLESLRTNLRGTENVLDATVRHHRRLLLASTSEVYGKNTADLLHEDSDRILGSPLLSRWTYAAAKGLDEAMTYAHVEADDLRAVIVRLFNTVGPRQRGHYGMVVPSLISQALAGQDITVYGDGRQTRCFSHVADIVPALTALIDCEPAVGQAVNLGGGLEISINQLAGRIITLLGSTSSIVHVPYDQAYGSGYEDMRRRVPDNSKAKALVGFVPRADLDTIITTVADGLLSEQGIKLGAVIQ
jgi:UDP-glucose 4-epimerase